ncbi:MAG: hypothetical protein FWD38_06690 [Oscillospiraceae bacterium]|nr:hypothetical protein [Oscillospiraceae bacterium]
MSAVNIGGLSGVNFNAAALYMKPPVSQQQAPSPVLSGLYPAISPVLQPSQGNSAMFFSIDGDRAEISYGLLEALKAEGVCETCENRRYVDQSNDSSVSFQTPTKISPNMAAAAVASHEQEHVRNEQANAQRDNREIISQSVTLTYDTCPECGKQYVSGGTTRTTSIGKSESEDDFEPHKIEAGGFNADTADED